VPNPADIVQLLLRALPDIQIEGKQFIAKGDKVVVQFIIYGTHKGDFLGIVGTGKRIELNGINIYRLMEGKIIETWRLADYWGILHQMGKF
jgi:predicted ester cyclase